MGQARCFQRDGKNSTWKSTGPADPMPGSQVTLMVPHVSDNQTGNCTGPPPLRLRSHLPWVPTEMSCSHVRHTGEGWCSQAVCRVSAVAWRGTGHSTGSQACGICRDTHPEDGDTGSGSFWKCSQPVRSLRKGSNAGEPRLKGVLGPAL